MPEKEKQKDLVMLVDDDDFLLDMYATKFKERGYDVITANDGKGALQRIADGAKPRIILIDMVMPGMDGFDLLTEIKKTEVAKSCALVMLSNQGQDTDLAQAKKLGADGYIIKASAIPSEVVNRAAEFCEKRKS